jgi:hypothetical protein
MTGEDLIAFIRKNLIVVICAVASITIGIVLYYRLDALPDAEKVLADKTKEGELIAANIEDSNQLKEQHAALVAANAVIDGRMIHVGQLAENLEYFYKLESATKAKLTDLRPLTWMAPMKNAPKTNYTAVPFALTAQGDYAELMDLMRKLESGEHYCRVISCDLKPLSETRGGTLSLTLNIELMGVQ